MSPFFRTLIFTIIAPGFWTVLVPYWVLGRGARLELRGAAGAGGLLVVAGVPYRVVRNPMYWSVACVMLGEAVTFRSVALAEIGCVFFAFAALFVMVFEEPMLRRKFGEEYEAYRRQVPGWFPHFRNKLD